MAEASFALRGMDHFTVITNDCDRTQAFYEMIGLRVGPRPPDLGGTGLWMYHGATPILHVVTRQELPGDNGLLDHMAFRATGLGRAVDMLREKGIGWRLRRLDEPFAVWQMFFKDPFGTNVELDFDGDEPPPSNWPGGKGWVSG